MRTSISKKSKISKIAAGRSAQQKMVRLTTNVPAEISSFIRTMERSGVKTEELVTFALGVVQEAMNEDVRSRTSVKSPVAVKPAGRSVRKASGRRTVKKAVSRKVTSKRKTARRAKGRR